MQRVADLLLRYPRAAFAALVALSLGAALHLALGGVRFDYNLEGFLPAGDPTIQEYEAFTAAYEPDDAFIVTGFETGPPGSAYRYETLRDVADMTAALEGIEGVEEVVSLTSLENIRGTTDGIEVAPVVERLSPEPDSLRALEKRLRADSLAVGYVVSRAGDATTLLIQIDPGLNQFETRGAIIDQAQAALQPWAERYDFRWSGFPYLRNAYVELLQVEVVRSVGMASFVILLILLWMFRSARGVLLPLVVVWLGVMWTIATIMLAGSSIDVLTSSTAAIVLVVAVADSIHLLSKYLDGVAGGLEKRAAIRQMVVRLGAATLLTSVTTAIGFATLATSRVVPMQRFGVFTAAGVMLTFAISLVLVTTVLLWTRPPKPGVVARLGGVGNFSRFLGWADRVTVRRPKTVVAVCAGIIALAAWGATGLRVNSLINDDLGPRTEVYQDIRFFEERIVSPFRFEVVLSTDEPDAFKDPALLRTVESVQDYLEEQPFVTRTVSPVDLLKQLNRAMRADSAAAYRLPTSEALTAQYLFLLELTDEAFLRRFADFDFREVRVSANMADVGSARIKEFREGFADYLDQNLPEGVEITTTGTIVLAADLSDYLVESLLLSIGLAFVFISILMGFLFRDARLVLVSLVPNVVPLIVVAGIMGAAGIDIKPATAVIFSIAFGIAVDDTIHVLARLRQEMAAGLALREAVRETIFGTGKAIILTSLILLGGFLVLTLSPFQSTTYMGILVSATIVLALLADLLLLPALLYLVYPEGRRAAAPAERAAAAQPL